MGEDARILSLVLRAEARRCSTATIPEQNRIVHLVLGSDYAQSNRDLQISDGVSVLVPAMRELNLLSLRRTKPPPPSSQVSVIRLGIGAIVGPTGRLAYRDIPSSIFGYRQC